MIRTYSEMSQAETLEERYRYLRLGGDYGSETYEFDRWIKQAFYKSREWRLARNHVIARDYGRDLGVDGYEIHDQVYVHHMNPLKSGEVIQGEEDLIDPEFLVCVSHNTHNAIHYGNEKLLPRPLVERRPGDTKFW